MAKAAPRDVMGRIVSVPADCRFWQFVNKDKDCWEWEGAINRISHYGVFNDGKHTVSAHRYSWFLAHGTIPVDLSVLHKCDNRSCVNPAHLFLGTALDNQRDSKKKGRNCKGEAKPGSKLTIQKAAQVKELLRDGISQPKIARKFGVSRSTILNIKRGQSWAWV